MVTMQWHVYQVIIAASELKYQLNINLRFGQPYKRPTAAVQSTAAVSASTNCCLQVLAGLLQEPECLPTFRVLKQVAVRVKTV